MTSHAARLYALAGALLVFFVSWAVIAAHPWRSAKADPRLEALAAREERLRREAVLVQQLVDERTAAYRAALAERNGLAAARASAARAAAAAPAPAPRVRVVTLPPLTVTRTS